MSISFNETALQIITNALTLLGVINSTETPTSNDQTFCLNMLQAMIKGWEGQGIHLWAESEAIIPFTVGVNTYYLATGNSTMAGDSAVQTNLSVTALSGATTITVNSVFGMAVNDNIGIVLDSGSYFWTTVTSVNTSTLVVGLTSGLTGQASSGATVVDYTTQLARPLNIINARYYYGNGGLERKMQKMGRTEYMQLPNKQVQAPSTAFYYSPQLSQGILYVWPTPYTSTDTLHISYMQSINDISSISSTLDFPNEWLDPITFNLAVRVAPAYGISLQKENPDLAQQAAGMLQEMLAWDTEEGGVRMVPNYRYDR